jgi:hypothetical protein
MTHAEAIEKLASLTEESFVIHSDVWRHTNSNPEIEFRVSICADIYPDGCTSFIEKTLDGAVNKMVEFLSPKADNSRLGSLDASLVDLIEGLGKSLAGLIVPPNDGSPAMAGSGGPLTGPQLSESVCADLDCPE